MNIKKEYVYGVVGIIAIFTAFQFTKALFSSIITLAIIAIGGMYAYKKYKS